MLIGFFYSSENGLRANVLQMQKSIQRKLYTHVKFNKNLTTARESDGFDSEIGETVFRVCLQFWPFQQV